MEWMILPYKRYAEFGGRSQRMEYWMFQLFTVLVSLAIALVLGGNTAVAASMGRTPSLLGSLVSGAFSLVNLIPSFAVLARRLHDTDRSGWWMLLLFLPVLGWIALFVFVVNDGTPGPNRFGDDPKGRGLYGVFN